MSDKVAQVYDAMADQYDENDNTVQFLAEDQVVYPALRGFRNGRDVIDLGCGTGRAVKWMKLTRSFRRYVGYDVSGKMLAIARKKFPKHEFVQKDMLEVEPRRGCMVISLYGSPCYMSLEALIEFMKKWQAGNGLYFLLYGYGRNPNTYEASQEAGKLKPQYYGDKEVLILKDHFPRLNFAGIDILEENKDITNVDEYENAIHSQFGSLNLDRYAWILVGHESV